MIGKVLEFTGTIMMAATGTAYVLLLFKNVGYKLKKKNKS